MEQRNVGDIFTFKYKGVTAKAIVCQAEIVHYKDFPDVGFRKSCTYCIFHTYRHLMSYGPPSLVCGLKYPQMCCKENGRDDEAVIEYRLYKEH